VNTLGLVTDRGRLICGVNDQAPGLGFIDADGDFAGFDIEFCRVIAAAVLGDADAVDFEALTTEQRFLALQGNDIDVLVRNTTWTSSRDGSEGLAFAATTFYDGQGVMVKADSGFDSLEDLDGATICVLSGTTTQLNLTSYFRARGLAFQPSVKTSNDEIAAPFRRDQCVAWTTDKSQLAGIRANWPQGQGGPEALLVFEETLSKEPLGPLVNDGDTNWFDAVNWAVLATIQAEEFGITSRNVDRIRDSTEDPEIQRFLGLNLPPEEPAEGESPEPAAPFDPGLDLPLDFAYQVVKQVGNYEEIYNRTLGPDTIVGLPRGVNSIWTDGGLLYAPPYR
jgi:general L-amino acid transport system substrate-binding protein